MKKIYSFLTIGLLSSLLILTSCGKGNNNLNEMEPFDIVMTIFFVLLIAFVIGVIIYFIIRHYRNR